MNFVPYDQAFLSNTVFIILIVALTVVLAFYTLVIAPETGRRMIVLGASGCVLLALILGTSIFFSIRDSNSKNDAFEEYEAAIEQRYDVRIEQLREDLRPPAARPADPGEYGNAVAVGHDDAGIVRTNVTFYWDGTQFLLLTQGDEELPLATSTQ